MEEKLSRNQKRRIKMQDARRYGKGLRIFALWSNLPVNNGFSVLRKKIAEVFDDKGTGWKYAVDNFLQKHPEAVKAYSEKRKRANQERRDRKVKVIGEIKPVIEKDFLVSNKSASSNDFLQTFEWRKLRLVALKLHGRKCQCCGATPESGAILNVDHIKPRKIYPELALDIDNLQVLCHECNHGKGNWDMTDFRTIGVDKKRSFLKDLINRTSNSR